MGQVDAKGTVGTNLDVSITLGNRLLRKMIVNAPLAEDNSTLIIYKNTASAANEVFNGYMSNRDVNGAINFLEGVGDSSTTKFIVAVSGGSGDLYALAIYD